MSIGLKNSEFRKNVDIFKKYVLEEVKEEFDILSSTFKDIKREKFNYLDYVLSERKQNKVNDEIIYGAYRNNLKKKLIFINNQRPQKNRIPEVRINSLVQNLKPLDKTKFSKLGSLSNELSEIAYSWINGTQGLGDDYSLLYNEAKGLNHKIQSIGEMVNEVVVTLGIVGGLEFLGLSEHPAGEIYQGLAVAHSVGRIGIYVFTGKNVRSIRQYFTPNPLIFAKSWHQLIEEAKDTASYRVLRSKFSSGIKQKMSGLKNGKLFEPDFLKQYIKEKYDI